MKGNTKNILPALAGIVLCAAGTISAETVPDNEYLDLDIAQLMQITVTTVAKKPQQLSDSAAAVFVITQDDIHRSGITSIPEALRLAPGIHVARIDANKWAVSARGFNGLAANKLLVMIDGRTVYHPIFSGVLWDVQDTLMEDIDRIEVIRGPGATIWGANAVNGVINVITKKASDTLGGLVRLGAGDEERVSGGLRYGTTISEHTAGRVYLTYKQSDSLVLHTTGEDGGDDWDTLRGGFRVDGEGERGDSWTFQGDVYANDENQTLYPFWEPIFPYMSKKNDELDSQGWNILGRYNKVFSGESGLSFQAYYDFVDREEAVLESSYRTLDLDLQYHHTPWKNHIMTYGLGYRLIDSDFDDTFQMRLTKESLSDALYSAFLQDEIMLLAEKLYLTLGVKWEHNDYTGQEWQPSARLLYKATDKQTLWTAVTRAVRTPCQAEYYSAALLALDPTSPPYPLEFRSMGSEDFVSEELYAYEAGYRFIPYTNLSLDLTLFYNEYKNLRNVEPLSLQQYNNMVVSNTLEGATYGLEVAADWKAMSNLRMQLGYSYMDYDLQVEEGSLNPLMVGITEQSSPKHQVSLLSSLDFTGSSPKRVPVSMKIIET